MTWLTVVLLIGSLLLPICSSQAPQPESLTVALRSPRGLLNGVFDANRIVLNALKRRVSSPRGGVHIAKPADAASTSSTSANLTALQQPQVRGLTGAIALGTPAQTFTVEFMTSYPDLWVVPNTCDDAVCKASTFFDYNRQRFDSSKSTSKGKSSRPDEPNNNFGPMTYITDTLAIAGTSVSNVNFGLLTKAKQSGSPFYNLFKYGPIDGVFGLAPAIDATQPTALNQLLSTLTAKTFTIWMSMGGTEGQVTFGTTDDAHCSVNWTYIAQVNGDSSWNVAGPTKAMFTDDVKDESTNAFTMFVAELPYIFAPEDFVIGVAKKLKATLSPVTSEVILDNCDMSNMPKLDLTFGDNTYSIPAMHYVEELQGGTCRLGLIPIPQGSSSVKTWILGSPFYQHFCVQHDVAGKRVGVAKQAEGSGNSASGLSPVSFLLMACTSFLSYFVLKF